MVSDYRLADRGSIFPLICVQTSYKAYPASYPIGTGDPFPGAKRGRWVKLLLTPSSAEVKNK
jgi:hypothetical protein